MKRSTPDPLKVLVVDDHHNTAVVTSRILKTAGHMVWIAESCADALEIVKANRIEMLVTDIGLPDCDGCDLLTDVLSHYPVVGVAFSGHLPPDERARCEKAGFTHFLPRPANLDTIVDAVTNAAQACNASR